MFLFLPRAGQRHALAFEFLFALSQRAELLLDLLDLPGVLSVVLLARFVPGLSIALELGPASLPIVLVLGPRLVVSVARFVVASGNDDGLSCRQVLFSGVDLGGLPCQALLCRGLLGLPRLPIFRQGRTLCDKLGLRFSRRFGSQSGLSLRVLQFLTTVDELRQLALQGFGPLLQTVARVFERRLLLRQIFLPPFDARSLFFQFATLLV